MLISAPIFCTLRGASTSLRLSGILSSSGGPSWHGSASLVSIRFKHDRQNQPQRNKNIQHPIVQVVNENGIQDPTPLTELLASVDLKTHFVELVSIKPAPLVKIYDKQIAGAKRKELKEKLKAQKVEHKEIQMTWGVEDRDLEHKFKKARAELERGNRVDIVIAPKSRQPVPPKEEMERRMQGIVDLLADVGEEWQDRALERRTAIMRFQRRRRSA